MTEKSIRLKVANIATKYLGCNESNGTHKQFVDRYNAQNKLPRNHKMTYSAAWCATFVSAISIECGLEKIMPTETSCNYMISAYQKIGCWQENDAYIPKVGDVIFYDWDDNGVGDNTDKADHVGIVVGVDVKNIYVIEGNNGNAVKRRTIKINGRYIRGFGVPAYSKLATPESTPKPAKIKCPYAEPKKLLKYGAKGVGVKWLQWHLNRCGFGLKIDGSFGPKTRNAVTKFQKNNGLVVDAIVGIKTRTKLKEKA